MTTNGLSYTGTTSYEDAALGVPLASYDSFQNIPDERYPQFAVNPSAGTFEILFASDYDQNGTEHILGFTHRLPGWTGVVVAYQPGEYQPNALDDLSGNYDAIVLDNEAGMEHLSRRTTNDVDILVGVMNPTLPSFRAVKRIMELSRKLPVNIAHRAVVVTRVGPEGIPEPVMAGLAELDVQRLIDVPQDDNVERAGAVGESVFTLPGESPALVAVNRIVDTLRATLTSKD